jgi:hypothetical protein
LMTVWACAIAAKVQSASAAHAVAHALLRAAFTFV